MMGVCLCVVYDVYVMYEYVADDMCVCVFVIYEGIEGCICGVCMLLCVCMCVYIVYVLSMGYVVDNVCVYVCLVYGVCMWYLELWGYLMCACVV